MPCECVYTDLAGKEDQSGSLFTEFPYPSSGVESYDDDIFQFGGFNTVNERSWPSSSAGTVPSWIHSALQAGPSNADLPVPIASFFPQSYGGVRDTPCVNHTNPPSYAEENVPEVAQQAGPEEDSDLDLDGEYEEDMGMFLLWDRCVDTDLYDLFLDEWNYAPGAW